MSKYVKICYIVIHLLCLSRGNDDANLALRSTTRLLEDFLRNTALLVF